MTQPVQEPSPDRAIAAMDYRTRQLARRPRPNPNTRAFADVTLPNMSPKIMAGVFDKDDEEQGYTIWPGGLVVQTLRGKEAGAGVASSDGTYRHHLLPEIAHILTTQQAADLAAASIVAEFTVEEAGLQTHMLGHPYSSGDEIDQGYRALVAVYLDGTSRTVRIAIGRDGTYGTEAVLTSGGRYWSQNHWGLVRVNIPTPAGLDQFEPGEVITIKMYADGASANMRLSLIYWVPHSGADIGPTDGVINFEQSIALFNEYLSGTATQDSGDNSTASTILTDSQYGEGCFDPYGLEPSFGGDGYTSPLQGFGASGLYVSTFDAQVIWEPRHAYQEARIAVADRSNPNVGYAILHRDSCHYEMVPIHSQDWGLVYWGPWNHIFQNLHWTLWLPQDQANGGTYLNDYSLDDADAEDLRMGDMWFPRDIYSRPMRYVDWP